jgi:hypothetical protein
MIDLGGGWSYWEPRATNRLLRGADKILHGMRASATAQKRRRHAKRPNGRGRGR